MIGIYSCSNTKQMQRSLSPKIKKQYFKASSKSLHRTSLLRIGSHKHSNSHLSNKHSQYSGYGTSMKASQGSRNPGKKLRKNGFEASTSLKQQKRKINKPLKKKKSFSKPREIPDTPPKGSRSRIKKVLPPNNPFANTPLSKEVGNFEYKSRKKIEKSPLEEDGLGDCVNMITGAGAPQESQIKEDLFKNASSE